MGRRQWELNGKVAFITGGASGIGLALGTEMGRHGAKIVLADHNADELRAASEQLIADGLDVATVELDVTDRDAFAEALTDAIVTHGRVDLLVNSAGISMGGPTHELTGQHWDKVIDVNLGGVINGVLAAYPHMIEAGQGRIVNIASAAGLVAPPFVVPYATSKQAVVGLSLALGPEAASHGVSISAVCPGPVDTPILDQLPSTELPPTATAPVTGRAYLTAVGQSPVDVDKFATTALRRIVRGDPLIVLPAQTRALWLANRISPALTRRVIRFLASKVQRDLIGSTSTTAVTPFVDRGLSR